MEDQSLLSQAEIDALLAAVSGGGNEAKESFSPASPTAAASAGKQVPADNIRRYDFRRPDRFSKEQMRALRMIHETWARRVSVSLSAALRTSVEVNLADIDQDSYTSLINHVADQGLYYIVSLLPLPGHLMLHMNLELAMIAVDRILGGPGAIWKAQRGLTELEIELLRNMSERMLADMSEAWAMTLPVRPRVDDISLNLMLIPIALPTDAVVWITLEVRVKGTTNSMVLGLPYSVLKPIGGRLSPYTWLAADEAERTDANKLHKRDIARALNRVTVPVSAQLGSAQLSLEELAALKAGDVILLGITTDALCSVLVNERQKYLARPGTQRRHTAIEVVEITDQNLPPPEELEAAGLNVSPIHQEAM
jgi:flagellar motor switch protein FliM